jgi:hypothetical protein
VLHISMEDDSIYLDGNRWQRLILSHLPHLWVFDIFVSNKLRYDRKLNEYITMMDQFNSLFWFERQYSSLNIRLMKNSTISMNMKESIS